MKVDIQKAVLKSWSLLPKNIKLVLFTDSEYWKERAREADIDWSDAFEYLEDEPSLFPRLNRSGLPFLTSMTEWIQAHYRTRLYVYAKGDISLHSAIQDVLPRLFALSSPLLVVGRRYNTAVTASLLSHFTSLPSIDRFIASSVRFTEQFIPVAQDYFFFSPAVLNPRHVLPVVVGRNRLDNYLLTFCKQSKNCQLVDASDAGSTFPRLE